MIISANLQPSFKDYLFLKDCKLTCLSDTKDLEYPTEEKLATVLTSTFENSFERIRLSERALSTITAN
jgi:hypothetical protein